MRGAPKIPGIVIKIFKKIFVQFGTFVPFKVQWLDAAIPAPLLLLETLSKTFNRNAVKGCQWFSVNLCNISVATLLAKNKMVVVSHPLLTQPHSLLLFFLFQGINQDLKGRHFADIAEAQQESLAALDGISIEDFRQCCQEWEWCSDHYIQSQGEYFEGD